MPFIVINSANAFDPANQQTYATAEEADAKAREILAAQPQATVRTAQLISTYSAQVTVTATPVPDADSDTAA